MAGLSNGRAADQKNELASISDAVRDQLYNEFYDQSRLLSLAILARFSERAR
jgi:hypothetical protein